MAAITPNGIDLPGLYAHVAGSLPAYARPVFLRFQGEAETTGTLKYRKVDLVKDGFDPMNTKDPLFLADHEKKTYVPIDVDLMRKIVGGGVRL
jgi:hypothetical protein